MTVQVKYTCDGCFEETVGADALRKEFRGVTGRPWGFGSYHFVNTVESVAPEGWVPFDPYTQACYCPSCWAGIIEDEPQEKGAEDAE